MDKKIKLITALDLLFIFLLCVSGSLNGAMSNAVYYASFIAPIAIGTYFIYGPRENSHASDVNEKFSIKRDLLQDLSMTKDAAALALPLVFPAIGLVLLISFLTNMLLGTLGYESSTVIEESFGMAILIHALLPAILEELLFRFIPIRLLRDNGRAAIILSSVLFAFAHASLFQIPYALAAGIAFGVLYLITGSIVPSILLHFFNNFLSLISLFGYGDGWLVPAIAILAAVSLVPIFLLRKRYSEALRRSLPKKEKCEFSYAPLAFIGVSLLLAITSLFA